MKYPIAAALFAFAISGCASVDPVESATVDAPVAETVSSEDTQPECAEGAEDCDQSGTDFRPPMRTN